MPRGQKPGWKLSAKVPKGLPSKPLRLETGVWLRPSGKFFAYVYHRGKDVFIGSFATPHEAVVARAQKLQEIEVGRQVVRRSATAVTVTDFAEHVYLPEKLPLVKDSTARATMSRYRQHVVPAFADVPLRDVSYERICAFRTALMEKDVSGQTRRETLLILRAILEEAARRDLIPTNPAARVELPRKGGQPISVPSYADAVRVVSAITHPVARMAASLLLQTGCRMNEALSLEWPNVDVEAGTIYIAHSIDQVAGKLVTPKTKTAVRIVEIPPELAAELRAYRAGQLAGTIQRHDPWVFPSETERTEGRPAVLCDRNLVQRYWDPAVRAVGCGRFTPHSFRHLYASTLLMNGTPVTFVAQQLGHSSPAFTYRQYARFLPSPDSGKSYLKRAFGSG